MNIMDEKRKRFKNVIDEYDYARPTYPIALYDRIQIFSNIGSASKILEVGAGTGQATDLFLSHGHRLDLIEVSDKQVAFLKKKYSQCANIRVYQEYFEDYSTDTEYDLIYSATAFHWIKCENGYPKAWKMLRNGGTMAVFWNVSLDVYHRGGIFDQLNEIAEKYKASSAEYEMNEIELIKEKRIKQITVEGYFDVPEYYEFRWTECYTAQKYAALMLTVGNALMINESDKIAYRREVESYIEANGGVVEVPEIVCLYLVKKQLNCGKSD